MRGRIVFAGEPSEVAASDVLARHLGPAAAPDVLARYLGPAAAPTLTQGR